MTPWCAVFLPLFWYRARMADAPTAYRSVGARSLVLVCAFSRVTGSFFQQNQTIIYFFSRGSGATATQCPCPVVLLYQIYSFAIYCKFPNNWNIETENHFLRIEMESKWNPFNKNGIEMDWSWPRSWWSWYGCRCRCRASCAWSLIKFSFKVYMR